MYPTSSRRSSNSPCPKSSNSFWMLIGSNLWLRFAAWMIQRVMCSACIDCHQDITGGVHHTLQVDRGGPFSCTAQVAYMQEEDDERCFLCPRHLAKSFRLMSDEDVKNMAERGIQPAVVGDFCPWRSYLERCVCGSHQAPTDPTSCAHPPHSSNP